MIISEKQIFQLLHIATDATFLLSSHGRKYDEWVGMVAKLLDTINNQQSEELRTIE
jgi:hypothetical protein